MVEEHDPTSRLEKSKNSYSVDEFANIDSQRTDMQHDGRLFQKHASHLDFGGVR